MANLQAVNIFMRAKTPEILVSLQLANNEANAIQYSYKTPVWTGKDWIVWFFADLKSWNDPTKLTEEARKLASELSK